MVRSRLRLDLHTHTFYSSDGLMSPRSLLETAAARGIDCLAVTDHDTLEGADVCARVAAGNPSLPRVIRGEEVSTPLGEIIGLYLKEEIPGGLAPREVCARIVEQGGLVYLPHPCDKERRSAIDPSVIGDLARSAHIIEVMNGRSLSSRADRAALDLAAEMGALLGVGSDAHCAGELGHCYLEVPMMPERRNFQEMVKRGRPSPEPGIRRRVFAFGFQLRSGAEKLRRRVRLGRTGSGIRKR